MNTAENKMISKSYSHGLLIPGMLVYGIIFVLPTVVSFYFSLTRWDLLHVEFIGLDNFKTFLTQPSTRTAIPHTLVYAIITCVCKVVLALAIAVILSNEKIKSRTYLKSLIYSSCILSTVAVGITFTQLMHPSKGLINQALRVLGLPTYKFLTDKNMALGSVMFVDVWRGLGTAMVIYLSGLGAISKDYYEAAAIDGATGWKQFTKITLPLLVPSINSVLTLSLIGGLKSYELLWTMTSGGPGYSTEILGTVIYKLFARSSYGLATAGNVLMFIIVCAIIFPLNSYISKKTVEL